MKKSILVIVLLQLLSLFTFCESPDSLFSKGVKEYQHENYVVSARDFQQLYDLGYKNFEVCYNLGNSYYKINDMSSAILYYERAQKIMPNNQDVINNIEVANKKIVDNIESVPEMFYVKWWNSITQWFSPKTWCYFGIFFLVIFLAGLSMIFVTRNIKLRKTSFWISIVFLVLFVFSVFVCSSIKKYSNNMSSAIVFSGSVTAKGSPTENSVDLFVIHRGTKVDVTDKVGQWIEIKLANGKVGWILTEDVKII